MANIFKAKTLIGKSGIFSQEVTAPNLVYNTGDQIIFGNKTFLNNIQISGTGIFNAVDLNNINEFEFSGINIDLVDSNVYVSGGNIYISGNPIITGVNLSSYALSSQVVYTTGNQIISGNKTFINDLKIQGTGIFNYLDLSNISEFNFSGTNINLIDGNVNISGGTMYISGNRVLTGVNLIPYALSNQVVYVTGNQVVSGNKTFTNTGFFDAIQITNSKLSSYNYISSNFIFGNTYINIVNSSNNVIGTLPSGIISGINYYVKNLNSGILLITGSGQRTIDGFFNISLYKNESLQLLGVNNIGYTGWITLSADIGVS